MTCEAQRQSDEMYCARCRLRWEADGLGEPISCPKKAQELSNGFTPDPDESAQFHRRIGSILRALDEG